MKTVFLLLSVFFSTTIFADFKQDIKKIEKEEATFLSKSNRQSKTIQSQLSKGKIKDIKKALALLDKLDTNLFCNDEGYLKKYQAIVKECNLKNLSLFEKSISKMSCKSYPMEVNFLKNITTLSKKENIKDAELETVRKMLVNYSQQLVDTNNYEMGSFLVVHALLVEYATNFKTESLEKLTALQAEAVALESKTNESLKEIFTKKQNELKNREEMDCFFLKERQTLRENIIPQLKENLKKSLQLI